MINETEYRVSLLLEAYRALIGNVTNEMRKISLRWNGIDSIDIQVLFSRNPTEEDKEIVSGIMAEIIAGFPEVNKCREYCLFNEQAQINIEPFGEVIFLKYEDQ